MWSFFPSIWIWVIEKVNSTFKQNNILCAYEPFCVQAHYSLQWWCWEEKGEWLTNKAAWNSRAFVRDCNIVLQCGLFHGISYVWYIYVKVGFHLLFLSRDLLQFAIDLFCLTRTEPKSIMVHIPRDKRNRKKVDRVIKIASSGNQPLVRTQCSTV